MIRALTTTQSFSKVQRNATKVTSFTSLHKPRSKILGDELGYVPSSSHRVHSSLHRTSRASQTDELAETVLQAAQNRYQLVGGSGHLPTSPPAWAKQPLHTRRAVLTDVASIWNLLQSPIRDGTVLPVSYDTLCACVSDFSIYYVGSQAAGFAALKYYASAHCSELSKIVTHPGFRGRGIAKDLVRKGVLQAASQGLRYVFALSLEPAMIHVFLSLGFREVPREQLPQEWAKSYDFSRPSRGFIFPLSGPSQHL